MTLIAIHIACYSCCFISRILTLPELRTPLNAAHSGMQLLQADLTMSTRPEDIDRLDTLNDVALSITTTVDIRTYSLSTTHTTLSYFKHLFQCAMYFIQTCTLIVFFFFVHRTTITSLSIISQRFAII